VVSCTAADARTACCCRVCNAATLPCRATHWCTTTARTPATGIVKPYIMGREARKGEQPQSLTDMLPDWVGYGTLYGISVIPVLLVVGTVLILFYNSLK
jgi:hypothetical protein